MSKIKATLSLKKLSDFFSKSRLIAWKETVLAHPVVKKITARVANHRVTLALRKKFNSLEWKEKIILIFGGLAFVMFLTTPYALLFRESKTLTAETEKRGGSLALLLAASNQVALSENRSILYSTSSVASELGVKDAWIVDKDNNIVAPAERYGKTFVGNKAKANPESCTRWTSGLDYQFACPIFKWVEVDAGFKKQIMAYAYIDYTAAATLNFRSYRGFELFKFLTWFVIIFGILGYAAIKIVQKPLLDLKFDLRAFSRGASPHFPEPQHFAELKDLALEIKDCLNSKTPVIATSAVSADVREFVATLDPFLDRNMLYINSEKIVTYANPALKQKFQIEENTHILRAFGSNAVSDAIIRFLSQAMETAEQTVTETIPGVGTIQILPFQGNGKNSYFLFFEKE